MFKLIKKYLKAKKEERENIAEFMRKMDEVRSGLPAFSNNNFEYDSTIRKYTSSNIFFGGL